VDHGIVIRVRGKTAWREVEVGRGSSDHTCCPTALSTPLSHQLPRVDGGFQPRRLLSIADRNRCYAPTCLFSIF
jgi:hypothetical protein